MPQALVIDDEPAICRCFETLLQQLNCEVEIAASAEDGLKIAENTSVDLVVLDVRLPGMDGLDAISRIREHTNAPIIVITAHGDLSTAVTAVRAGAFEYIPKPFELDHVTQVLNRALADGAAGANPTTPPPSRQNPLVGESPPMQQLFRQIALAAQHDGPVLITGESGTGKELVAHAIHEHSPRSTNSIVPVHLASVNESLMERELFGHAAGAFTGAERSQIGLLNRAAGGSLFLDEIGEASPAIQVKLLRILESGEFYRVGSSAPEESDFRLITATNRSVEELRSSEDFRSDFFFRLATIHIHVPPLRERRSDIAGLAEFFLNQGDSRQRTFSPAALQALERHDYPGNVRELKNVVLNACSQTPATVIDLEQLAFNDPPAGDTSGPFALQAAAKAWAEATLLSKQSGLLAIASEILERELIAVALRHTQGNRSAAAQALGIHRETLRDKIDRFGLDRPSDDFSSAEK